MLALTLDLVSVMMIASLAGQVKLLVLSPSCFFHWTNQRGRKRTHTTLLQWRGLPFTSVAWSIIHIMDALSS